MRSLVTHDNKENIYTVPVTFMLQVLIAIINKHYVEAFSTAISLTNLAKA